MKLILCNNCFGYFPMPEDYQEQEKEFCCHECTKNTEVIK